MYKQLVLRIPYVQAAKTCILSDQEGILGCFKDSSSWF